MLFFHANSLSRVRGKKPRSWLQGGWGQRHQKGQAKWAYTMLVLSFLILPEGHFVTGCFGQNFLEGACVLLSAVSGASTSLWLLALNRDVEVYPPRDSQGEQSTEQHKCCKTGSLKPVTATSRLQTHPTNIFFRTCYQRALNSTGTISSNLSINLKNFT